jgi:hypothetical protein
MVIALLFSRLPQETTESAIIISEANLISIIKKSEKKEMLFYLRMRKKYPTI